MTKKIQNSVDIHQILTKLGFDKNEIEVYIKLLELGGSTLTNLSVVMGVPRTNIYRAVDKLEDKTIVYRIEKNGKKLLKAEHPKKLEVVLKNKEADAAKYLKELKELRDTLPLTIKTIVDILPNSLDKNPPIVKFYQGIQGFKAVCERSITNSTKETYFISNMDKWKKVFTDEYAYNYYVPKRLEKKLFAKTLAVKTSLAGKIKSKDEEYFREMRFLPESFYFEPTIIISDEEVSIMISNKPYSAILVQHKETTKLLKDFFNYLWEVSI